MAKRAKNDGGVDRINNFPDEICCRILSFLPTREAVRTSILSTRWRYLFAYLSNFDIDFRLGFGYRIDSFAKFMLKRLYFRTETLEHFRFRMKNVGETSDLDIGRLYDWISAALHRGVGELHLDFPHYMPRYHHHSLPSDMFICKTLNPYVLSSPPEKVPSCLLSHLKEIEISVHLGDLEMVAYFLLNARVLEKLTIRQVYGFPEVHFYWFSDQLLFHVMCHES
ncbi:hypothetical protein COLO4_28255 [Corchorus olitorius]|uniref:F-box domain-containing protein n=1 Tax=Corchorus olitorius TaxID=93759 RepID=A0A1R3HM64_9ROSI|nr:hypothetical protein COLO4_28255 [Corchorus olitorius]